MTKYGQEITAFIQETNGAIICPHCELEMACAPDAPIYYCGSGQFGDGHFIDARHVNGD